MNFLKAMEDLKKFFKLLNYIRIENLSCDDSVMMTFKTFFKLNIT